MTVLRTVLSFVLLFGFIVTLVYGVKLTQNQAEYKFIKYFMHQGSVKNLFILILNKLQPVAEKFKWGDYHQNDYDVKMERGQVLWYNHSYLRNAEFKVDFYNRTVKALNGSFIFRVDIKENYLLDVQFYKFMSNEYRFFPVTLTANVCAEYARNSFNMQEALNKSSNFRGCPMKKGYYYLRKLVPDFSNCPPYIPRGAFKMDINFRIGTVPVINAEGYGSILDKPVKWD